MWGFELRVLRKPYNAVQNIYTTEYSPSTYRKDVFKTHFVLGITGNLKNNSI
jgi:hypothetical protein